MDFFTKLGETLSVAGKDVSQKAKDLTGLAKLNIDVRAKEDYVLHQYEEIGRQYFQLHQEDEEPVFQEISFVKEALEEIRLLREEIDGLKGLKKCPSCGAAMDIEAEYCVKCGKKYDSIFEEEEAQQTTEGTGEAKE